MKGADARRGILQGNQVMERGSAMISVIIPAYNAGEYIDSCLRSVLTQRDAEFEVIVVNDGSVDCTGRLCREWSRRFGNLRCVEQEHRGQGTARNNGIRHASGEWLVFLDADDELVPGALRRLQEIAAAGETDIICYEFFLRHHGSREDERIRLFDGECRGNGDLLRESTSFLWDKMFRAAFWRREGLLLDDGYGEDFRAVCLLEALCGSFGFLREPLVRHYERGDNLSSNARKVMEIAGAVEGTVKEFIDRGLLERYEIPMFYVVCRQYRIYQEPDFCDFGPGQAEGIRRELERILKTYFGKRYCWLERLWKTELILIGRRCRLGHGDMGVFRKAAFYGDLEQYVIGSGESGAELSLYMVDLAQEGRSRRFGTRTAEWQKRRWEELAGEFVRKAYQTGKVLSVFVFDREDMDNRGLLQLLMERGGAVCIQEDTPVLEALAAQESAHADLNCWGVRQPERMGMAGRYWCGGEQYRLQFNEDILNAWLMLKNRNINFSSFFTERGYQEAAVYGMGHLGERLLEELAGSGIDVAYCIDRAGKKGKGYMVYGIEDELPRADVIVVTVVHLFFEVKQELEKRTSTPVVSLEEVIGALL